MCTTYSSHEGTLTVQGSTNTRLIKQQDNMCALPCLTFAHETHHLISDMQEACVLILRVHSQALLYLSFRRTLLLLYNAP
jgi:hypothetical protein